MPPRKRATRASKKKEEEEQVDQEEQVEVQEPPKKQTRRKSRNKATPNTTLEQVPQAEPALEKAEAVEPPKDPTPVKQQPKAKSKATVTGTAKTTVKAAATNIEALEPVKSSTPAQKVESASQKSDFPSHQSPSKRLAIPSSRLPSPKKKSLAGRPDPLDVKKAEAVVHKAFSSRDSVKLSGVLDDLKTTRADQIFNEYRANAEIRFKNSDDLISSLTARNNELADEVNDLRSYIASLEKQTSNNVNEEEQYQSQLILDMMEQIVGLRLHRALETEDALSFDCSQSGKNGILDYKLTISKEDSSEIIYTPMNVSDEAEILKSYLPDYFFDNLTFPLDTLQQFYHKIYRGLNK